MVCQEPRWKCCWSNGGGCGIASSNFWKLLGPGSSLDPSPIFGFFAGGNAVTGGSGEKWIWSRRWFKWWAAGMITGDAGTDADDGAPCFGAAMLAPECNAIGGVWGCTGCTDALLGVAAQANDIADYKIDQNVWHHYFWQCHKHSGQWLDSAA